MEGGLAAAAAGVPALGLLLFHHNISFQQTSAALVITLSSQHFISANISCLVRK
jgi:hypothetical protein